MDEIIINEIRQQKEFEHKQFTQWLKTTYQLKDLLQINYDRIYQDSFYVKIFELITSGKNYIQMFNDTIEQNNYEASIKYKLLLKIIDDILSSFKESELDFIEFRRHSSSHIFTKGYNFIQDDFKLKEIKNKKSLIDIHSNFDSIFKKHKTTKNFDLYFNSIVFKYLDIINLKF